MVFQILAQANNVTLNANEHKHEEPNHETSVTDKIVSKWGIDRLRQGIGRL